jgi:hypothetical protein
MCCQLRQGSTTCRSARLQQCTLVPQWQSSGRSVWALVGWVCLDLLALLVKLLQALCLQQQRMAAAALARQVI